MSRMRKILWCNLPLVLGLRVPVLAILFIVILLCQYAEKSYEWCYDHLPALNE